MEKEILKIIKQGENEKVEFKENISNIDKEIVAFANSNGGRIFIGVDDKNKVKGVKITREEIAKKIDLSLPGIKNNIAKLKQKKLLKRVGPDKGGYWEICHL